MTIQRSGRFERVKKPLKSDMNVVPYIDVMLVLLVIFMVTAPMITTGVKVDLPQANNNPIQSEDRPAIVTLEADGTIKLEDKNHKNEVLTLDELKTVLTENQQQAQANNKQLSVLINGSESRPYGEVMKLMSTLQDAGLSQVGLLTESVK
ncbi:protein TolR [Acinetobacter guillouiae]|jgi:biopolymer transport protein TolR|uniref:Tol-Pal system protein TolR n=1 Tax=Acinetobacter guillouiae TaxID=106649 RepID=A0A077L1P2_ACIGI|nr:MULTISPECIES: protein TolR [Acinetobacter]ENU56902.1 protein TolR [Acinetobacter guillouiae CIP 63.46]EPH35286.1 Tol biopolymer transport system, TolR protein [Acinetobacter guillouiae MSP4-18]KAB0623959.1 protein TolR [Acinetobacter guillouiae]KEC85433.1 biopolymer transporter TolR [Acinetobacter sp. ETR1]KQW88105.1 protein TolR [Acinetobacter sp. Root1280]